jgi:hypothetical protein
MQIVINFLVLKVIPRSYNPGASLKIPLRQRII